MPYARVDAVIKALRNPSGRLRVIFIAWSIWSRLKTCV